ncbi:MAG: hypothetical protein BRC23_02005 [Parcubacteria group bacterium SW_4_49_11]|nr:MAG: hypothetical protein BRC23_02005 [Parcubacteria group bacterium SW_4_49_11]
MSYGSSSPIGPQDPQTADEHMLITDVAATREIHIKKGVHGTWHSAGKIKRQCIEKLVNGQSAEPAGDEWTPLTWAHVYRFLFHKGILTDEEVLCRMGDMEVDEFLLLPVPIEYMKAKLEKLRFR